MNHLFFISRMKNKYNFYRMIRYRIKVRNKVFPNGQLKFTPHTTNGIGISHYCISAIFKKPFYRIFSHSSKYQIIRINNFLSIPLINHMSNPRFIRVLTRYKKQDTYKNKYSPHKQQAFYTNHETRG